MAQTIQLRGDTAANWATVNPVLAQREMAIETDTMLYKIGDGSTAWNDLAYGTLNLPSAVLAFVGQSSIPSAPSSGNGNLFFKDLCGRMLLRMQGPTGLTTPVQPSLFQNFMAIISTNATTTVSTLGNSATSVGTLSHPAATEDYGYMTNFVSAGTALATAGTGFRDTLFMRGVTAGKANGFFFNARTLFPDASYDQTGASTGSRICIGMTNQALATAVATDTSTGHCILFMRCHTDTGRQDSNWQLVTRDGTNVNVIDTGMPFSATKIFDAYLFCPPASSIVNWRIDNITDGTTAEGTVSANLPGVTTLLRGGFQVQSVDAIARNCRMQRVYCESDR